MKTKVKYNSKILDNFKRNILQHVNLNIKDYMILSIIFILGVMIGVIIINNSDEQSKIEINGYINSFIQTIKEEHYEIDRVKLIQISIVNNLKIVGIIWIASSTIIGIPLIYLTILYKGFSIGYTISAIILTIGTWNGIAFSLASLFLQNIIIIPILLMLSVSALKLYRTLVKHSTTTTVKQEISRHTAVCVILIIPLILASCIETYISTWLLCLYN